MEIRKGEQHSVAVRFRRKGRPAAFRNPPAWTLYNSADEPLLSGTASNQGDQWVASFTVPSRYLVPGGREDLTVQFVGYDTDNFSFTSDKQVTVTDTEEEWKPTGVVWNALTRRPVRDTLLLDTETATVTASVYDPRGVPLVAGTPVASTSYNESSAGFQHRFEFDLAAVIATPSRYTEPLQIVYEPDDGESEIHPLYVLDSKVLATVQSLKTYLDKSDLREIDASLQWSLPELVQAVYEGLKTVNAWEPEGTFWTFADFPPTLDRFLFAASAIYALSSRALAEGLNSFEFTGLNTSLNYNRADVLNAKVEELNAILERLTASKRSAININGKGTAPVGTNDNRSRNLGVLRLSVNRMNNAPGWTGRNRFRPR